MKKKNLITRIAALEKELAEMKRQRDMLIENKPEDVCPIAEIRAMYQFEKVLKRLEEFEFQAFRRSWREDGILRTGGIISHIAASVSPEKPPLGLVPKYIRDSERIEEIQNAIRRYRAAGKKVPDAWYMELGNILLSQ